MKSWIITLCVLCCGLPARAAWVPLGDNTYVWTDLTGKPDGWVYTWHSYHYGQWYSQPVRPLTQAELQQFQPQQQAYDQQIYGQNSAQASAYVYGNGHGAPEKGWQGRFLEVLGKRDETARFAELMNKHFPATQQYQQGYGVQTPYGAMQSQSLSIQQAGGNPASILIGDLPQVQGNTVYGSVDPTYNSFAAPLREFDFGSLANTLASMDVAREAGSVRISSETRAILGQITDSARVLHELQMRSQLAQQQNQTELERWRAMAALMTPSRSQTLQIQTDRNGTATFRVLPEAGGSPATPPTLPLEGGADETFRRFAAAASANCLRCHGGPDTGGGSEKLLMGKGSALAIESVKEDQIPKVFGRVRDGSMPPGGKLSAEAKQAFADMEAMLMKGGPASETPPPPPKP